MNFSLKAPARLGLSFALCVSPVFGLRGTLCTRGERYAHAPRCLTAAIIVMENDHEKAQYAWDYRWSRVVDCDALLTSMVAKECGAVA
jgi:hypothetical protein